MVAGVVGAGVRVCRGVEEGEGDEGGSEFRSGGMMGGCPRVQEGRWRGVMRRSGTQLVAERGGDTLMW